jgi:redox-sensitive bicupin YhaK (pirin superfamily)
MINQVQLVIESRAKELAGMPISRVLPWAKKRMVGPFIFLDHLGPVHFDSEHKLTVNPHPHIGLSTLTYLFKGHIHHRDSLGSSEIILPGEVNWMTAGRGISHSEKTPQNEQGQEIDVHGLQFWVALPDHLEDMEPSFFSFKNAQIPKLYKEGAEIDVVVGEFHGEVSPVEAYSPLIFINIRATSDYTFEYESRSFEVALYLIEGSVQVGDVTYTNHEMIVFEPGSDVEVNMSAGSHCVLIGGETFPKPKFIWWNFVSSSKEKMATARDDWNSKKFPQVPGDTANIPAPLDKI